MKPAFEMLFEGETAAQQRLYLHHPPRAPVRGKVLAVQAFAEEMNKCRRMLRQQAGLLADAGFAVLAVDLAGCGDSAGDFGDATWQGWLDDIGRAAAWLDARHEGPLWLWGTRIGCLLAVEAAARRPGEHRFVFWQPSVDGAKALQQFLRLKAAAEMAADAPRSGVEGLRQRLQAGEPVEVAGYTLNPALADGLARARLQPPAGGGRLVWLEVSGRSEPALAPASPPLLQAWRAAGYAATAQVVPGTSFWQAAEPQEAPALLQATMAALAGPAA